MTRRLKKEFYKNFRLVVMLIAVFFTATLPIFAAEWNTNANGDWNVNGNWTNPGTFPNAIDAVADFSKLDITANRTVSLEADLTLGYMLLGDSSGSSRYTIQDGASGNLTFDVSSGKSSVRMLNNSGLHYLNTTMFMNDDLNIINESTTDILYIYGPIENNGYTLTFSGNSDISVNTQGTAILSGSGNIIVDDVYYNTRGPSHTYTGNIILVNGAEMLVDDNNFSTGTLILKGGVMLNYWSDTYTNTLGTGTGQISIQSGNSGISGQGSSGTRFRFNNSAAFEMVWGSTHFNPNIFVLSSTRANANGDTSIENDIDLNGSDRTIECRKENTDDGGYARLEGDIRTSSGTAGIIKKGIGVLRLSGSNSYNGTTLVDEGILEFESSGTIGGTGRSVFVSTGANVAARYAMDNSFLNRLAESSNVFSVCLGLNSTNDLDFGSATGATLPNAILGVRGNRTYSGTLTPANSAYKLGGGHYGTLTVSSTLGGANSLNCYGAVTLTGTVSYSGDTSVESGTLTVGSINSNNATSTVTVDTGATMDLNYSGTMTVQYLYIGGTEQVPGVYGPGGNTSHAEITGTGNMNVTGALNPPGTIIQLR